ncbi:MAG: hypothetical protein ACREYE_06490 [Gammaproteobacteria bacterium]
MQAQSNDLYAKEREHALRVLGEIKAIEELRAAVLQDLGVLRRGVHSKTFTEEHDASTVQ